MSDLPAHDPLVEAGLPAVTLEARLYALLKTQGTVRIEELARELRASKTAIRRALTTLEEEGAIAISREEA